MIILVLGFFRSIKEALDFLLMNVLNFGRTQIEALDLKIESSLDSSCPQMQITADEG